MTKWTRRLWIIPPLAIGLGVILFAKSVKSPPQQVEVAERAVKVRAIKVSKLTILPRSIGYGTTRPGRSWDAVAEVSGQVAWVADELEDGRLVAAGTELLRIDDASYRLSLEQIRAQLNASAIKDRATESSILIEEKGLALLKRDLRDKRALSERGAVAGTTVDAIQQQVYVAEGKVQNLRNALAINAAERDVLAAQKALAEFELSKTLLRAPFDIRITEVKANLAQYANMGQQLFSADGIASAEVEAQFAIGNLRPLIAANGNDAGDPKAVGALARAPGASRLDAVVRLKTGTHEIEWKGRVDRVAGRIDPQTQSIGVVVVVDAPYGQAEPGRRPPLTRNTFVEVELRSQPKPGQIAIPTSALHEGRIYVLDEDSRLEIRPVKVKFSQRGYTVLAKGLAAGERIVVSDLIPAVEGMLLEPQEDKKTRNQLIKEATGKEPTKGPKQ